MPELCRFFGIVIRMFYNDHAPPHFHAEYGDFRAAIAIESQIVIGGHLPKRALALVTEWVLLNQDDLMENWRRTRAKQPPLPMSPLE